LSESIQENEPKLNAWCNWYRVREEAVAAGLSPVVEAVESGLSDRTGAEELFETAYARWFAAHVIDAEPRLAELITDVHMNDIDNYRRLEDRLAELSVRYIRAKLCGKIPDKNNVSRKDGFGVLKHQLQLQRRHKPVRQLATEMGEAFTTLAPCMLMSPLSIAQYLPADHALFDLVIFDEASQIAPWDAIGSIARGRQVVIAGDPRQMPPTSFFNRAAGATDDDEGTDEDMESILDECLAAGVPQHSLQWHYRSRHESLIAFSNSRYYENRLVTFPAPETRESAVAWRKVDGVYAKGIGRTNQAEAEAIVAETVRRLTDPAFVGAGRTLGIVTLNSDQQRLVEDLLDKARRSQPRIERYFAEELTEPVVVKNLETVQGDERDLILLGIGYGPTELGAPTMSMNFGPLNRDGGWRRLNVAVTRARREMVLFTSFDSTMIDLNRTSARAVRDLKHFIEFAERGPRALAEAVQGSIGDHESPFELAVAEALTRRGWTVVPQIGVSRFRIDLGIVHPDRPGDYLVGIECDGAAYHSAATARDRDKVRAAILEGLGWKLIRTWSTDWWVDREGAADRLHLAIEAALTQSRAEGVPDDQTPPTPADQQHLEREIGQNTERSQSDAHAPVVEIELAEPAAALANYVAAPAVAGVKSVYRATDFATVQGSIDASQFYELSYEDTLVTLIGHVLDFEAPISESQLVQRIARAHGFKRAGRIIRDRVMQITKRHFHVAKDSRVFVWLNRQQQDDWCEFRLPASDADVRQIEDIAPEELRAAASACGTDDREVELARLFGIRRLSSSARQIVTVAL
jgi:very-short-patch-repair endonuclease